MKVFLIGYYGYNNYGDELLLSSITEWFSTQGFFDVKVLSYNASETERVYRVKGVSRSKGLGLIRHIATTDVVIVGGGSILQDTTSSKSLYYYMGILGLAKLFGKSVYLLGNGFGPVTKNINKQLLTLLVPRFDGVITRDAQAYEAFRKFKPKRIHSGVDCVFLKDVQRDTSSLENSPYVAISLRPWRDDKNTLDRASVIVDTLKNLGYRSVLVPMKEPDDRLLGDKLIALRPDVQQIANNEEALEACFRHAHFTIGMRLHALIITALYAKPFIALSYDPKVTAFTEQFGQLLGGTTETVSNEDMIKAILHMHHNYSDYKNTAAVTIHEIKLMAKNQMELLDNWLKHTT
jgi:polysaccharide pyruvyl transferase CsaB